jgi:hypothetical protein
MNVETNPLKQYFRRPQIYLKLPSNGDGYPKGAINFPENNELPIYPMTTIDEITSKTPDAVYNGNAIVDIIKSCVPNIKDPWLINSCDLDALLIAIKTASNGSKLEINTICPSCQNEAKYDVNLTYMLKDIKYPKYNLEYKIDGLIFKFKPLPFIVMNKINNGQFEIQRSLINLDNIQDDKEKLAEGNKLMLSMTTLTIQAISHGIEYIKTNNTIVHQKEHIYEYLVNIEKNVFNDIKTIFSNLKNESQNKPLNITCNNCGHKYEQEFTLNFTDFFDQGS